MYSLILSYDRTDVPSDYQIEATITITFCNIAIISSFFHYCIINALSFLCTKHNRQMFWLAVWQYYIVHSRHNLLQCLAAQIFVDYLPDVNLLVYQNNSIKKKIRIDTSQYARMFKGGFPRLKKTCI